MRKYQFPLYGVLAGWALTYISFGQSETMGIVAGMMIAPLIIASAGLLGITFGTTAPELYGHARSLLVFLAFSLCTVPFIATNYFPHIFHTHASQCKFFNPIVDSPCEGKVPLSYHLAKAIIGIVEGPIGGLLQLVFACIGILTFVWATCDGSKLRPMLFSSSLFLLFSSSMILCLRAVVMLFFGMELPCCGLAP